MGVGDSVAALERGGMYAMHIISTAHAQSRCGRSMVSSSFKFVGSSTSPQGAREKFGLGTRLVCRQMAHIARPEMT